MKLIVALSITFILVRTVDSDMLQCFSCEDAGCTTTKLMECDGGNVCSTTTYFQNPPMISWGGLSTFFPGWGGRVSPGISGHTNKVLKGCHNHGKACPKLEHIYSISLNIGYVRAAITSLSCNTTGCNNKTLSAPSEKPNGLHCFTCKSENDTMCDQKVMECVGIEDRCFIEIEGIHFTRRGCVSSNYCDTGLLSANSTCCKESWCNSANGMGVSLRSLSLLLALPVILLLF